MTISPFDQVENTVEKGENAGYHICLLYPQFFPKPPSLGSLKAGIVWYRVNFLPNYKIFDWSKMKAFTDDKKKVTEKFKFVLGRVENIVGKGENAGYQHFSEVLKVGIMW